MSRRPPSNATSGLGAVAAAAIVLLVGCANLEDIVNEIGAGGAQGPRTVAYACDDDERFAARFSADRDQVRVRLDDDGDDETYDLELVDRDGGRRVYSEEDEDEDNSVRLTVSDGGRSAYLRVPDGEDLGDCEAEL